MTETGAQEDRIYIRFEGGLADEHHIPVQEFITSLEGWHEFLELSAGAFLQGRLTTERPPRDRRIRYEIQTVREGSVEVVLETVGTWAASGFVGNVAYKSIAALTKALWRWRQRAFSQQVKSHRDDATVEEAAAALAKLAAENRVVVGREDDPVEFVNKIDA